jgi:hypothetical protein
LVSLSVASCFQFYLSQNPPSTAHETAHETTQQITEE